MAGAVCVFWHALQDSDLEVKPVLYYLPGMNISVQHLGFLQCCSLLRKWLFESAAEIDSYFGGWSAGLKVVGEV
jgi:hypothetical protein